MMPALTLLLSSFLLGGTPVLLLLPFLPPDSTSAISKSDSTSDGWEYLPKDPTVVYKPNLSWPPNVKSSKRLIKVFCKVEIDTLGKPLKAFLLKSQDKALNKHAFELAKQYRFTPWEFMGKKKRVWLTIPMSFQNPDSLGR